MHSDLMSLKYCPSSSTEGGVGMNPCINNDSWLLFQLLDLLLDLLSGPLSDLLFALQSDRQSDLLSLDLVSLVFCTLF